MKNLLLLFYLLYFCFHAKADTNGPLQKLDPTDSLPRCVLVNSSYWCNWSVFSSVSDFAEIQFNDNQTFTFKSGKIAWNDKSTIVTESYQGIWHLDDSLITINYVNPLVGKIEKQLKIINLNELLLLDQYPCGGFMRKPIINFPSSEK